MVFANYTSVIFIFETDTENRPENRGEHMAHDKCRKVMGKVIIRAMIRIKEKMPYLIIAQIPGFCFLYGAGMSTMASLILFLRGDHHKSLFVGQWAPVLLLLGIYRKMVRMAFA